MDVLLKKYFVVVNLVAVGLCASLGGAAAAHYVEATWLLANEEAQQAMEAQLHPHVAPPNTERVHDKDDTVIIKRNIFCSQCAPPKPPVAPGPGAEKQITIEKSGLPYELVATMWVGPDSPWSMAVIRETSSKEKDAKMYAKGRVLEGTTVTVVRVDPQKVYLRNAGRIEFLEIEGSAKPKELAAAAAPDPALLANNGDPLANDVARGVRCTGNSQCEVDRSLVDKLLSNTTALATSARFVPSVKDGRPNGFKLYAIQPTSIFGKIGLQNGDTIKAINGMDMTTPDQALAIYSKLRTASHLTVAVERRAETVTLDYSIR